MTTTRIQAIEYLLDAYSAGNLSDDQLEQKMSDLGLSGTFSTDGYWCGYDTHTAYGVEIPTGILRQ